MKFDFGRGFEFRRLHQSALGPNSPRNRYRDIAISLITVHSVGGVKVSTELEDIMQFMPDAVAYVTGQQNR